MTYRISSGTVRKHVGKPGGVGQVRAGPGHVSAAWVWLAHRWHGQAQITLFLQLLQAAPNLPVWPLFGHNPPSPPRWGSAQALAKCPQELLQAPSLSCTPSEHLALVAMSGQVPKPNTFKQTRHLPPSTASPSKPLAQRMIHTIHLFPRAQNPGSPLGSSLPPLSPH